MTRYEINSRNEIILKTRTRIDDLLSSWEETKIGKIEDSKIPKLFENPITAIAYTTDNDGRNDLVFEFDKKDIIRAIDFWINDRIQLNERRLLLKGNLRDVDEKELKQLVTLRQNIDKEHDKDSKYCRYRNHKDDYRHMSTYTVTFYKIMPQQHRIWNTTNSNSTSRYYNLTTTSRDDGTRWDFGPSSPSDEISIRTIGGRHQETEAERAGRLYNDGFPWIYSSNPHTWRIRANDNVIVDSSGNEVRITGTRLSYSTFRQASSGLEGHRNVWDSRNTRNSVLEQRPAGDVDPDPNHWVVRASIMNHNEFRVVDGNRRSVATGFRSSAMATAYIRGHQQGITVRESMAELHRSGLISREELRDAFRLTTPSSTTETSFEDHINNFTIRPNTMMNVVGHAGESLTRGDIIVRIPTNNRWYKVVPDIPNRLTCMVCVQDCNVFGAVVAVNLSDIIRDNISIVGNHNIPAEITTPGPLTDRNGNFVNVNVQELYNNTYEDMMCLRLSDIVMAEGLPNYVSCRLQLSDILVTIDTEIYIDNRLIDQLHRFGERFRVRLLDESHILIDHNSYNMISCTVTENLMFNLVREGSPRRFNNMRIQRFSQENTSLGNSYIQCSLDLVSVDDKCRIDNLILEDRGDTLMDVLRRLSSSTVNVRIERNKIITINGYAYTIHAPMNRIEVQYSNH